MTDPVSALVGKWERDAEFFRQEKNSACAAVSALHCDIHASELREALKLRPRGSAEQAQEIARLKAQIVELQAGARP